MPAKLKTCIITPTHKGGSKADAVNYRPIALTSHLIKVFEKILRNHITVYMDENNLFNPNQHGFRKGHSCLSELLDHYDNVLDFLNDSNNVDVIYLDFAKAFDKVDFGIVLQKIKKLGVDNKTFKWILSFLTGRTQNVVVNDQFSDEKPVISGVPQGSVLGPLIFLILLGDIDANVKASKVRSFADDTRAMNGIQNLCHASQLQNDLDSIYNWTETNNMELNEVKFELLRYGKIETLKENTAYLSPTNSVIAEKLTVKDLGVLMSASNSFNDQIEKTIEKAKQISSWILRSFHSRNQTLMLTLWKSLALPIVEYCSILWSPTKIHDIQQLEQLQWSFLRKIQGNQNLNYWECLSKYQMYSLQRRRERYMIIYIWKILEGRVPNVNNKVTANYNIRLGRKCNICPNSKYQQITGIGITLFNLIPKHIRDTTGTQIDSFKKALDKFLMQVPDEPHVPSHPHRRAKTNSLVDVIRTWNLDRGRALNCSS